MQTDEEKVDLKQYLYDLLVVEKRTKNLHERTQQNIINWQEKAAYARQKEEWELAEKADQLVIEAKAEAAELEQELGELQAKISYCKKEVAKPSFSPMVDVNELEAQFEVLLGTEGEEIELDKKIQEHKVEDDLAALKKQLGLE